MLKKRENVVESFRLDKRGHNVLSYELWNKYK